jgi:hypothetical protein
MFTSRRHAQGEEMIREDRNSKNAESISLLRTKETLECCMCLTCINIQKAEDPAENGISVTVAAVLQTDTAFENSMVGNTYTISP